MRFVIFGIGKMYQTYKPRFRKDIDIVAFIDNQPDKWGQKVDGVTVYAPEELENLEYDVIFLLSVYYLDMQMQLRQLGVPRDKIYTIDSHIESLCAEEEIQYYGEFRANDSKEKRVLIFSHALTSTGAQNVLYHAVCVMKKNGFQLMVISKSDGILREKLGALDIPVIIIEDIYSKKSAIERLITWADLIFINTLLLYDTALALSNYNKKLVWWIHETGILRYIGEDFKYIEKNKHVSIYAVSPLVKRLIKNEYGEGLEIRHLTYGLPQYKVESRDNRYNAKMVFAVIGWIGHIKGQDIFLKAVDRLPAAIREQAEFWIVGGGCLLKEEMEIAERYSCIKVLGEIENARMREIYSQIDVVVCSSREDAMPVAVAEGCMTEKLVIVSDAVGTVDFIEHGKTGLIFKSEDVSDLAGQMKWAVEHKGSVGQIGEAAQEVYNNYFSMDVFEDKLMAIIDN